MVEVGLAGIGGNRLANRPRTRLAIPPDVSDPSFANPVLGSDPIDSRAVRCRYNSSLGSRATEGAVISTGLFHGRGIDRYIARIESLM
jgi:hypothetical protein